MRPAVLPPKNSPSSHRIRGFVGPRTNLVTVVERKLQSNLGHPAGSLVTILTGLRPKALNDIVVALGTKVRVTAMLGATERSRVFKIVDQRHGHPCNCCKNLAS